MPQIFDAETGTPSKWVKAVNWSVATNDVAEARLDLDFTTVEVTGAVKVYIGSKRVKSIVFADGETAEFEV